jgi:hypothetical protein
MVVRRSIAIVVSVFAVPRAVLACPVCFGQTDSPLAGAMDLGVLVLLGVVGAVLAAFGAFIVHLNRRAAASAEAVQESHVQAQIVEGTS